MRERNGLLARLLRRRRDERHRGRAHGLRRLHSLAAWPHRRCYSRWLCRTKEKAISTKLFNTQNNYQHQRVSRSNVIVGNCSHFKECVKNTHYNSMFQESGNQCEVTETRLKQKGDKLRLHAKIRG